jgi:hypothetical protein
MATPQQKAFCVLRLAKSESAIIMQREFRKLFQSDPPSKTNIYRWYRQFQGKCLERPTMSEENVKRIRESNAQSPRKLLRR